MAIEQESKSFPVKNAGTNLQERREFSANISDCVFNEPLFATNFTLIADLLVIFPKK